MSFLSPWMLYGLAGLAAPILIHLWRRRRVVPAPFGTLRFLKAVAARTRRSSRVENLLLLLLRCALFALVALAFARPVTRLGAAGLGGDAPGTAVLLLDNSLSMSYRAGSRTRLDAAKEEALAVIDHLRPGDRVAALAVSDHVEPLVPEPTVDHAVARASIMNVPQTEAGTRFATALREAAQIAGRAERGVRQIYLFTDNQASGWQFDPSSVFDAAWKASDVSLIVVRPDDLGSNNATLARVKLQTPYLTAGATARAVATVENFSTAPFHDVIELHIEDARVAQRPVDVAPGGSVDVPIEFSAPAISTRWARGVARLSGDRLPGDDQFFFTAPVYQPPRVLIAEGDQIGPDREHSGYYLRKALGVSGDTLAAVRTIPVSGLDDAAVEGYSAILLADPGQLSDRAVERLDRFLDAGGTVAIFPGDRATNLWRLDFSPVTDAVLSDLPAGRLPAKIDDPADPLFVDAWDANTPFPAPPQRRILDVKLAPQAKALVTVGADMPFVAARSRGPGRVILVNASADRAWGDFPLSPAFLPLVGQIVRTSAAQSAGARQLMVGDAIPMAPNLPRDQPLTMIFPDSSTRDFANGRKSVLLDQAAASGFYEVRAGDQSALFAVNVDRRESDLTPIEPAALAKIVPHELLVGLDNLKLWLAQPRGLSPVWPQLLVLALLVCGAESTLSNAMARKRSQGDDAHIATGRLNKGRAGVPFRPAETGGRT